MNLFMILLKKAYKYHKFYYAFCDRPFIEHFFPFLEIDIRHFNTAVMWKCCTALPYSLALILVSSSFGVPHNGGILWQAPIHPSHLMSLLAMIYGLTTRAQFLYYHLPSVLQILSTEIEAVLLCFMRKFECKLVKEYTFSLRQCPPTFFEAAFCFEETSLLQ